MVSAVGVLLVLATGMAGPVAVRPVGPAGRSRLCPELLLEPKEFLELGSGETDPEDLRSGISGGRRGVAVLFSGAAGS
jgi:hypothetical protein